VRRRGWMWFAGRGLMQSDFEDGIWNDPLYRRESREVGALVLGFLMGLAFGCGVAFVVLAVAL